MWISTNGMKLWLLFIFSGLLFAFCGSVASQSPVGSPKTGQTVVVITSGDASIYSRALLGLKQYSPGININHYTLEEWESERRESGKQLQRLIVAIGARATASILKTDGDFSALSLMVPSVTFNELVKGHPGSQEKIYDGRLSAIYMDQPATRKINLAKIIAPDLKVIGTLYEQNSQMLADQLGQAAEEHQIEFKANKLSRDDNPIIALRNLYREIDLFIAIPGKYIFNKSTAKWMLYLSYKNHKPLLGFSSDYVSAGALAAVYSTPESIARQASEWIELYFSSGEFHFFPSYPSYYDISVNSEVAAKLNMKPDSEAVLKWEMNKLESIP